jgi:hypothetical protein
MSIILNINVEKQGRARPSVNVLLNTCPLKGFFNYQTVIGIKPKISNHSNSYLPGNLFIFYTPCLPRSREVLWVFNEDTRSVLLQLREESGPNLD